MNNPSPQQLADVIKKLRTDKDLTQAQVGAALGISRSSVSNIERGVGDVTYKNLIDIATFYGIGVGKIIWLAMPNKCVADEELPTIKSQKSWIIRFGEFIFGKD